VGSLGEFFQRAAGGMGEHVAIGYRRRSDSTKVRPDHPDVQTDRSHEAELAKVSVGGLIQTERRRR